MDKDSIREFLEKRSQGTTGEDYLPRITPNNSEEKIGKSKKRLKLIKYILILLVTLVTIPAVYIGISVYQKIKVSNQDNQEYIIERVGKLTQIDDSETPKIVTVTNADSIKNQAFFRESIIGDKLLIFELSKKAILYRPSTDRIISIAPLN